MNIENAKLIYEDLDKAWKEGKIKEFDMNDYGGLDSLKQEDIHQCKTCACFIGWMPVHTRFTPVKSDFDRVGRFYYDDYSIRVFNMGYDSNKDSSIWSFLFSSLWSSADKTFEGAMKRLKYVIDGKYKSDWNYEDFQEGWEYPAT